MDYTLEVLTNLAMKDICNVYHLVKINCQIHQVLLVGIDMKIVLKFLRVGVFLQQWLVR